MNNRERMTSRHSLFSSEHVYGSSDRRDRREMIVKDIDDALKGWRIPRSSGRIRTRIESIRYSLRDGEDIQAASKGGNGLNPSDILKK